VDRLRDYSPRAVDGFASRRGQRRFLLRIVCEKTKRGLIESLEGCSICDMGLYSHRTGPKTVLKSAPRFIDQKVTQLRDQFKKLLRISMNTLVGTNLIQIITVRES
jgi:hypothetical protein